MGSQATQKAKEQREAIWRARLARFASSGEAVKAFCERESVSAWSFYQWRKALGVVGGETGPAQKEPPASFIDVGALTAPQKGSVMRLEDAVEAAAGGIEIRLELGGAVLTIVRR